MQVRTMSFRSGWFRPVTSWQYPILVPGSNSQASW